MRLLKPEYVFNPRQIPRRIAYAFRKTQPEQALTPWGLHLRFDPNELHGRAMLTLGLSDIRTCEMISRIVRPRDICVDVGANIGIMTSLMSARSQGGKVYAFEPHPITYNILRQNVRSWKSSDEPAVEPIPVALSDSKGSAYLFQANDFHENSGTASLEHDLDIHEPSEALEVEKTTFDHFFAEEPKIRLVKIDVEGHEDAVLAGMNIALSEGRIDFLIVEELRALPSPASDLLEEKGYTVHLIDRGFFGPKLLPLSENPRRIVREATNLIASRDPRELRWLQRRGWSALGV